MHSLWNLSAPLWQFLFRGAIIYLAVLFLLRIGGKRQIGQMGAAEFVSILLISNAVQNSMNGGDNSITGGLVLASVLVALSEVVAYLSFKSKKVEQFFQGRPTLLIHKGRILHENMSKELMNMHELKTVLRKQGIHDFSEVYEAVLESDGSISVTKCSDLKTSLAPSQTAAGQPDA